MNLDHLQHRGEPERTTEWLVRAKFEVPRSQRPPVERPHLLKLADQALRYRLLAVSAPAGFGKTTLLAEWRDASIARNVDVAWLTLDDFDSDARQLICYCVLALARAGLALAQLETLAAQGLEGVPLRSAMNNLLNQVASHPRHVALILDDYHRVGSSEIDDLVADLIGSAPPNFHLVIAARHAPLPDMPRLLAYGQAVEINADRLRFSLEETRRALEMELDASNLQLLFERTEGWPVAIQLGRLLLARGEADSALRENFSGQAPLFAGYLAQQVLSGLPETFQDFLARTSILERFNASLANALCGEENAWASLERLETLQVLIARDGGAGGWFRYNHLFLEFLRDLLRRRFPGEVAQLHLRASEWFDREGLISEAVRHAGMAEDFDRCARLIEAAGGWELVLSGGQGQLRSLLRHLPRRELARFPRLQVAAAYLALKDGYGNEGRVLFNAACANPVRPMLSAGDAAALERDILAVGASLHIFEDWRVTAEEVDRLEALRVQSEVSDPLLCGMTCCAKSISLLALARFEEAYEAAKLATRAMRRTDKVLAVNYTFFHAGIASLYRARFHDAEADFAKALAIAEDNFGADSGLKSLADILSAALSFWKGQLEPDDATLGEALNRSEQYGGWFEVYAAGIEAEIGLALKRDDELAAQAALERAQRLAEKWDGERLTDLAAAFELELALQFKWDERRRAVEERLASRYLPGCWRDWPYAWRVYAQASLSLAAARLERDPPGALAMLDDAVTCWRTLNARLYLVRALLARAILLNRTGAKGRALEDIFEAVKIAAPERMKGPFIGDFRLVPIIRSALRSGREDGADTALLAFLDECLRNCDLGLVGADIGQLSPREREVLQELMQGHTNKQIARQLDLTEHTVKFHLKNIFAKLGVDARADAVNLVRQMKLVA